ncbi:hypothetical protein [Bernardetia sp.]|uniref:hypothetical protein n=1 Tax=Bernardetia sp. TaxID=1937974 RepID=UPI0025C7021E|nr:hypothetical protein [Bernardetia sp.]
MKKLLLSFAFSLIFLVSFGQTNINTSLGYSTHGTGDMFGYGASFGVEKTLPEISNRLSLGFNARFTTHSREDIFEGINATLIDDWNANFRIVTSGAQLEVVPAFNLVQTEGFSFRFHAGIIGRYEVTNHPSIYGYTIMPNDEYNFSLRNENTNDFKRFDVGYISQLSMKFKVSNRSSLGIAMGFQNDTNGSAITSIPISYYFSL